MRFASLSTASRLNIIGLLMALFGIGVQIIGGVKYPPVPPGPILLILAVVLVLFTKWTWVPFVSVIVPLFLLVGGSIAPTGRHNMTDPGHLGPFVGTLMQMIGVALAVVAGLFVLVEISRGRRARL